MRKGDGCLKRGEGLLRRGESAERQYEARGITTDPLNGNKERVNIIRRPAQIPTEGEGEVSSTKENIFHSAPTRSADKGREGGKNSFTWEREKNLV